MRKYIILFAAALLAFQFANAQNKKIIAEKGISVIKTFEQDVAQGEKKLLIEKEEYFNKDGELIEEKRIDEKGKIKSWDKYIYENKLLIEEQKLNYRGTIVERIKYKYNDGVKIEKLYFDEKNRLVKKKVYEYFNH